MACLTLVATRRRPGRPGAIGLLGNSPGLTPRLVQGPWRWREEVGSGVLRTAALDRAILASTAVAPTQDDHGHPAFIVL